MAPFAEAVQCLAIHLQRTLYSLHALLGDLRIFVTFPWGADLEGMWLLYEMDP